MNKNIMLKIGIMAVICTTLAACHKNINSNNNKKSTTSTSTSISNNSSIKSLSSTNNSSSINTMSNSDYSNQQSTITTNQSSSNLKINTTSINNNKNHNYTYDSNHQNHNQPQNINLTTQQLGTLTCLYNRPAWFNAYINNDLWYGSINSNNNHTYKNNMIGYHYITAKGDPTSWLYYKKVGNNVIIKYINPNVYPVSKAPMVQESIPINKLINEYYNTPNKKQQVNNYANQLQPYN